MEQTREPGQMKRQESFQRFFDVFVTGGKGQCRANYTDGAACVYRDNHGNGCAIGIQPEFMEIYEARFEAHGIDSLYSAHEEIRAIIHPQDLDYFAGLQELHDGELQHGMKRLLAAMREFASTFHVLMPEEVEA